MSRASRTRDLLRLSFLAAVLLAFLVLSAFAQVSDTRQIDAYLKAITNSDVSSRLSALERFTSTAPASNLRVDALEWIVWDEKQTHNDAAAATWAQKLLQADPENPLALAITSQSDGQSPLPSPARHNKNAPASAAELDASRGLASLPQLRRPEGMSHDEFSRLQHYVEATLYSVVGYAALARHDYAAARPLLAKAVAESPNDVRLLYSLALADLSGDRPDRQQGYWLLARAVNLAGGASSAPEIAEFGRKKYKEDGGSDRDWRQFLAVTAAPGADAAAMVSRGTTMSHGSSTRERPDKAKPSTTVARAPAKRQKVEKQQQVAAKDSRTSKRTWAGEPEPPPQSTAGNTLPPISGENLVRRSGPPVSLGILVETSLAQKGTRAALVHSLTDLVRRMGADDEAFILSFSNDLVFEEDLTGDAGRLEHALDQIKPHPGTALLDAAGFAAGHLRRIAKNDSRVLLVISDGKNANSRIPVLATSNEIRGSGVRIYCIGVDVSGNDGMARLQSLASITGGTAAFISPGSSRGASPRGVEEQFRAAAQQVAGHMGIRFDY